MTTQSSAGRPGDGVSDGRTRRRVGIGVGIAGGVLALGYLGLVLTQGDDIPGGTTVAGVDVGGKSQDEAKKALTAHASKVSAQPVSLTVKEAKVDVVPADSGMAIDVPASLEGLGGRSFAPWTLLSRLGGGSAHDPVVRVDQTKLADSISAKVGQKISSAPKDGSVSFDKGEVEVVRSTPGQGVDAEKVAGQVAAGWPDQRSFTAPVTQRDARLKNTEIDRFVKEFARPAMSGPVTVKSGGTSGKLTPRQLSRVIQVENKGGKLTAKVDGKKAGELLLEGTPELSTPATNAKLTFNGGNVSTTPAKDGHELDVSKLAAPLLASLTSPTRTVDAPTKTVKPTVTDADLKGIDTGSEMSIFRSRFPGGASNAARTNNIRVALGILNGQVVAPGETFSLIKALGGRMEADQGYQGAPTIQGGVERKAMGGGVSQVSTTMYNAAFFAGVKLGEHKAHSFWIKRYPMGREATLWIPSIDNTWTNDTGKPILIRAGVEGDEAVIRFYGAKQYTVETSTSPKYNIKQPKVVQDDHPGCIPIPPEQGFSVDVTRVLKKGGAVVRTEKIHTDYNAADDVRCTNPSGD